VSNLLPPIDVVTALFGQEVRGKNVYRVDSLIGQGGMSSVYRATWLVRSRQVAIKVLHSKSAAIPELNKRFQREVATAQRLAHPNVVEVIDSGELADGSQFMVMELLEGAPLDEEIDKGKLKPERALALTAQILSALDAAHKMGVVHRDIKPSNVFLVTRDGVETAKLFDFGIALNDRAAVKLSIAGAAFGTPEYMSPEMARGEKVDGRADLYSVGVMLFEMLTGRLPFVRQDPLDLLRDHLGAEPPLLRSVAPELPEGLERVIARALVKQPAERFASAAEMHEAIFEEAARPARSRRRRRRMLFIAALLIMAATVAAFLLGRGKLEGW
jgi:eukaryotic-like serine/threonine-protein kinase